MRVVSAQHQAEAEMVQGILLEEGIPSMTRRSAGFDVPDMLAAGRRDILVPASGLPAARDVLMQADLLPAPGRAAPSSARRGCSASCWAWWSRRRSSPGSAPRSSPEPMHQRRLGDSDLEVSAIALGSWLTYSGGVGRARTEACTRAAFEAGITFFDTANVYGRGAAERAWGEILADYPRDSFAIATKLYFPMSAKDRGLSREQVHKQIDGSLERLGMDHVDLYQCHRYDDQTPLEETMQALTEVVRGRQGALDRLQRVARRARIEEALALPGVAKFVSSQPQYSALWRAPEAEVIPLCERHGISQIVWSPLAQGVLTGKYRAGRGGARGHARGLARHEPLHRAVAQRARCSTPSTGCGRSPRRRA